MLPPAAITPRTLPLGSEYFQISEGKQTGEPVCRQSVSVDDDRFMSDARQLTGSKGGYLLVGIFLDGPKLRGQFAAPGVL